MGIFTRFSDFLRLKLHTALDVLEDPREMLNYSSTMLLDRLQQLRHAIVEIVTGEQRLEHYQQELLLRINQLDQQAITALEARREDLARFALEKKTMLLQQMSNYEQQLVQLRSLEDHVIGLEKQISQQIDTLRSHKEEIQAQLYAAQEQLHAQELTSEISRRIADLYQVMQHAQEKFFSLQNSGESMNRLLSQEAPLEADPTYDEQQRRSTQELVETQLYTLKKQLRLDRPTNAQKQIEGPTPL